jgi:hypothetical protein
MAADQSANNKKGDLTTILLSIHDVLKLNQKGSELEFSASPSLFVPPSESRGRTCRGAAPGIVRPLQSTQLLEIAILRFGVLTSKLSHAVQSTSPERGIRRRSRNSGKTSH